ncbi:DUF4902 domain-containing protein [Roseateles sp. 22389]|uniref:DUF4902 domain-containing protein n=1 Tax=Roseateles sp. 22389 TaxID=3453916 RepID=UPI0026253246|nr:DUF4902 domain-containing protein [uncultured Roseateles sp.]
MQPSDNQAAGGSVSGDGWLRLPEAQVRALEIRHLMTGMDPDPDPDPSRSTRRCGTSVPVTGYTEWVGRCHPQLSIGWDWRLETLPSGLRGVRFVRVGAPRSNLLVSEGGIDLDCARNLVLLAAAIDRIDWQSAVCRAIFNFHSCPDYQNW